MRLSAVRDAGSAVIELLDVGFKPATPGFDPDNAQLEEDPEYGKCLRMLEDALKQFGPTETYEVRDYPLRHLESTRVFNGNKYSAIEISYKSNGTGQIKVIVQTPEYFITPIDDMNYELSRLEVGRRTAHGELAILVTELGSCAEALDYWVTDELDEAPFKSNTWRTARGVTPQAISNNVNSARDKLQDD